MAKLGAFSMVRVIAPLALLMVFAVSAATAQVPDCDPGALADYMKMSDQGCAVGKYRLSHFAYQPGPDGLPAGEISITAGVAPGGDDPGILVEGKWSRALPHPSVLSYTVEPLPAGKLLAGATLEMQFGQVTDTGEAHVTSELCPAQETAQHCAAADLTLRVSLSSTAPRKASDNGRLSGPAAHLRVTNKVIVTGGKNGAASFNGFMLVLHIAE